MSTILPIYTPPVLNTGSESISTLLNSELYDLEWLEWASNQDISAELRKAISKRLNEVKNNFAESV